MTPGPPHPPRELALVVASTALLAWLVSLVPPGDDHSLVAALRPTLWVVAWIGPAWRALERRKRDPLVALGLATRPKNPLSWAIAAATLPLYAVGFLLVRRAQGATLHAVPLDLWAIPTQLFLVALPEETFFRGSLQPSLLPARPYASIVVTSALFALAHLATELSPARLLVFFPSLLFGWLRYRSGSVIPSIVFHALCNVLELHLRSASS